MNAINTAATKVTGHDLFMYFFGLQGMYDHYSIFDEETDWNYRKVGCDMTTPDALEMIESMIKSGIHSVYWNHSKVRLIAEAELEKAKRIISDGERIPKCRLTVEHIEMLNVMKEQEDSVMECYQYRAGLLYMNDIIDYDQYEKIRGGIRKGAVHFSILKPRPELEPEPSNIDEIEREMFDAEFIEPDA